METLGPATETQAVSEMLAAIGEDPVEDVENLPPSGNTALATLRAASRDLQEEGYWFNQEDDWALEPDDDGYIIIPDEVISLHGMDSNLVERRPKLYDRDAKSYIFSDPVQCSVIFHRPWDELPSVVRRYVTALAIERFVDGFPGAQAITDARNRNLIRAKVAFDKAAIRNGRLTMLNNTTIQQLMRRS